MLSKHREVMQIEVRFPHPRNEFFDGWQERKPGWRWYEVSAVGTRKNGRRKVVYGYIFAPNKSMLSKNSKRWVLYRLLSFQGQIGIRLSNKITLLYRLPTQSISFVQ